MKHFEKSLGKNKFIILSLAAIFIVAIIVRFAYFPKNVYFSYDQARDFYFAEDILKGDLRIIGPPSAASDKLFPGPLSLYIYAFIQFLFGKDPETYSIFFRLYNALGIFLVYLIGSKLFDKKVGVLSASLYAFSYEQSQYTLLMSHQPLAVLSVLIMYLGLTMLLFEKKVKGLIVAALGLGLSIQFHYVYIFIIPSIFALLYVLRKQIPKLKTKNILTAFILFSVCLSTYVVSELKFNFRFITTLFSSSANSKLYLGEAFYATNRFVYDSFLADYKYTIYVLFLIMVVFAYFIFRTKFKEKGMFLFLWFVGGILPSLLSGTKGYYYSASASVSLLILFSIIIVFVYRSNKVLACVLFLAVLFNNYYLMLNQNPKGPNLEIVIQPGMLLPAEKKAIDYIYQNAKQKSFSVNALSVPLNINTTWSYLFEWYGKENYGYLPIWSVKPAEGFPGNLAYESSRSKHPDTLFVIIEPQNGIREVDKNKFFAEESYFTKIVEEKEFGTITIQKREKI